MKAFTVGTTATEGLPVSTEPYPHIPVGESGRGRQLTRVALGRRDFGEATKKVACTCRGDSQHMYNEPTEYDRENPLQCRNCGEKYEFVLHTNEHWYRRHPDRGEMTVPAFERVDHVDFITTKERGTLLVVKERQADNRAAVLLAVPAGYRGSTSVTCRPVGPKVPCPERGKTYGWSGSECCTQCGTPWIKREDGSLAHPDNGKVDECHSIGGHDSVRLVAEGYCAQGTAGRMGGHAEYLIIMRPGARVVVHRHGRLYGATPVLHIVWDGETLHVGPPDVVCQAGFEDSEEGEML